MSKADYIKTGDKNLIVPIHIQMHTRIRWICTYLLKFQYMDTAFENNIWGKIDGIIDTKNITCAH